MRVALMQLQFVATIEPHRGGGEGKYRIGGIHILKLRIGPNIEKHDSIDSYIHGSASMNNN